MSKEKAIDSLSDAHVLALSLYASQRGRSWKAQLYVAWESAGSGAPDYTQTRRSGRQAPPMRRQPARLPPVSRASEVYSEAPNHVDSGSAAGQAAPDPSA